MTLPSRLPEAVEATAYFVVSEALANTARHGDARQASVIGRMDGDRLVVEIGDDGWAAPPRRPGPAWRGWPTASRW